MAGSAGTISATLVEATPHLLKYLLAAGVASTSINASGSNTLVIGNAANGATPNLAVDALTGAGRPAHGTTQLLDIVNASRNGYKALAAGALTQAQARALLNSDDAAHAVLTNSNVMACEMFLSSRGPIATVPISAGAGIGGVSAAVQQPFFGADASIDASGNPTVIVKLSHINFSAGIVRAYLSIRCRYSTNW